VSSAAPDGSIKKEEEVYNQSIRVNYIDIQYIRAEAVRKKTLMTGLRSGGNRNLTAAAGGARAT